MIKLLLKKQLWEIFRSYFYDAKKNKARSKAGIAAYLILFVLLMVGLLGGMFTMMAVGLCEPLVSVGMGWLYFAITGLLAIFLGAFGSVFNTYSGLYLAKDNDLLLSLPIPVRALLVSRLLGVYLMGLMYSAVVILPAAIVYWVTVSHSAGAILGGVGLTVLISLIVLVLSCVLGWAVAKISLKLKHKSFITVLASLVFLGAYYFFYFKAGEMLSTLMSNAASYGAAIRGAAYPLYVFGRAGEGDLAALAAVAAVTALLLVLTGYVLSRSFLRIATSSGGVGKVAYRERAAKLRSVPRALFGRELARFTASPSYMLNCGLGLLLVPVGGVLILVKGAWLRDLAAMLGWDTGILTLMAAGLLCAMAAMVDITAPSISLEGKTLWLAQSLPVLPWEVLRAKLYLQVLLAGVPLAFAAVCTAIALRPGASGVLALLVLPQAFSVLMAAFGLFMDLKRPNLRWTNEIVPIKQNLSVVIVLFGGWALAAALLVGGYLLRGLLAPAVLLWVFVLLLALLDGLLLRWLKGRGAALFGSL